MVAAPVITWSLVRMYPSSRYTTPEPLPPPRLDSTSTETIEGGAASAPAATVGTVPWGATTREVRTPREVGVAVGSEEGSESSPMAARIPRVKTVPPKAPKAGPRIEKKRWGRPKHCGSSWRGARGRSFADRNSSAGPVRGGCATVPVGGGGGEGSIHLIVWRKGELLFEWPCRRRHSPPRPPSRRGAGRRRGPRRCFW